MFLTYLPNMRQYPQYTGMLYSIVVYPQFYSLFKVTSQDGQIGIDLTITMDFSNFDILVNMEVTVIILA